MNDSTDAGGSSSGPSRRRGERRGDSGLFGPESVTWRVHADPLMGVAALRALLLQALHPVTMDAVDQHSDYRDDPWGRLARTAEYIAVTTYGTTTEAMLVGSRVRAVHARITGRTSSGVEYTADDPQLLAWVHCCFVASFLEIVTRGGHALTGNEQDAYIAEQVRAAMLVGLEPEEVPHDRAGLLDYFRVIRPALDCSDAGRQAASVVINAPGPSAHAVWSAASGLAYAALPPWARRLYALPALTGLATLADAETTRALRTLRTTLRAVWCPTSHGPKVSAVHTGRPGTAH